VQGCSIYGYRSCAAQTVYTASLYLVHGSLFAGIYPLCVGRKRGDVPERLRLDKPDSHIPRQLQTLAIPSKQKGSCV
jgi:hypothetical protein